METKNKSKRFWEKNGIEFRNDEEMKYTLTEMGIEWNDNNWVDYSFSLGYGYNEIEQGWYEKNSTNLTNN